MAMLPGTRSPAAPSSASRSMRSGEWTASSAASQPPSEPPTTCDALEAEAVEDVEVVVDEVVHRLDLGQVVGAPEARMVGRHHREAAGEEPEEGVPRAGAAGRVEEEQRRTFAAALDVDRAAAASWSRSLAPSGSALAVSVTRSVRAQFVRCANMAERPLSGSLTCRKAMDTLPVGLLAHIRALCEHDETRLWGVVVGVVLAGRQGHGRVGGSTRMVWICGHRLDCDGWAYHGCPGWSWDDVLPESRQPRGRRPLGRRPARRRRSGAGDDALRARPDARRDGGLRRRRPACCSTTAAAARSSAGLGTRS